MNKKLFAFWKYDRYPYILGGLVVDFDDDGYVRVEGYPGYRFKPIKLLPLKAGQDLQAKLDVLEKEYSKAERELRAAFGKKVKEVFGE